MKEGVFTWPSGLSALSNNNNSMNLSMDLTNYYLDDNNTDYSGLSFLHFD